MFNALQSSITACVLVHLMHIKVAVTRQHVIAAIELNIMFSTIRSTTTGVLHAEIFVPANNFADYDHAVSW